MIFEAIKNSNRSMSWRRYFPACNTEYIVEYYIPRYLKYGAGAYYKRVKG